MHLTYVNSFWTVLETKQFNEFKDISGYKTNVTKYCQVKTTQFDGSCTS